MNDYKDKIVTIGKNIFTIVGMADKILFKFKLRDTNGGYFTPVVEFKNLTRN